MLFGIDGNIKKKNLLDCLDAIASIPISAATPRKRKMAQSVLIDQPCEKTLSLR